MVQRVAAFGGVLVAGLLLGLAGARLTAPGAEGPPASADAALGDLSVADGAPTGATATAGRATRPAQVAAASGGAAGAVSGFLAAEARGDYAASFAFLSLADRRAFDGPAGWVAAHAGLLPVTGFRIQSVERSGDAARVHTRLRLRAGLNEVAGLVPGRAEAMWTLLRENGGWRVAVQRTVVRPRWPADRLAPEAVSDWVRRRGVCAPGAADLLYGETAVAAPLCDAPATGLAVASRARRLDDDVDAQPFVAAFGVEATERLRTVEITAPAPLRAVVAPLGDRWRVVGLLRARP